MTWDENLEQTDLGYVYYHHSKYPLNIILEETEDSISVTVEKYYKGKLQRTLTIKSKKLGYMTQEQVENYILDVVDKFLKR